MKEKRNKRIPVLVTKSEYDGIRKKASQAGMSVGGYIRTVALSEEQMVIVDKSGVIVEHLGAICSAVQELEYQYPGVRENLGNVKTEVMELWHLLR